MFPNAPDQGTSWKNLRAVVLSALRSWVPKRWLWPTERVPLKRWLAPDIAPQKDMSAISCGE
jgi:hypothetical protein